MFTYIHPPVFRIKKKNGHDVVCMYSPEIAEGLETISWTSCATQHRYVLDISTLASSLEHPACLWSCGKSRLLNIVDCSKRRTSTLEIHFVSIQPGDKTKGCFIWVFWVFFFKLKKSYQLPPLLTKLAKIPCYPSSQSQGCRNEILPDSNMATAN